MRACVARAEAFFSRFLIQNDLFVPMFAHLKLGKRNDSAVCSAILELLAFIEKVFRSLPAGPRSFISLFADNQFASTLLC